MPVFAVVGMVLSSIGSVVGGVASTIGAGLGADALALTFAFPVRAKEKIAKKQNKNYFSVTSAITSWLAN